MTGRRSLYDANAKPFYYKADVTIAATSTNDGTINIAGDRDFWAVDMMFYAGGAAVGDLEIQIRDEGNAFEFMNNFVKTDLIFGDGKDPYTLSAAAHIRAGSTIGLRIKNTSATPRTVQLVLSGYKVPKGYVPGSGQRPAPAQAQRARPVLVRRRVQ
jgi:hypothetical protein